MSEEFYGKIIFHDINQNEKTGNFSKCQNICKSYGGTTVKIHSKDENEFVNSFIKKVVDDYNIGAYLGGSIYDVSDSMV